MGVRPHVGWDVRRKRGQTERDQVAGHDRSASRSSGRSQQVETNSGARTEGWGLIMKEAKAKKQ